MLSRLARVLIVDDEGENIAVLRAMLKPEGYVIETATSADQAMARVSDNLPDLILIDAEMPGTNGFQVTRRLKSDPATMTIPVILITEVGNRSYELLGLNAGAEEIMERPIERVEMLIRVRNLLRLKRHTNALSNHKRFLEQQVKGYTASLRESHLETIFALTRASRFKDQETGAHIRRISHYSLYLATSLGMDADFLDSIFHASPMHDIGKIGIPDEILLKAGPLTPHEMEVMKRHTIIGAAILGSSESPYLVMGAEIALRHHERWDGSGYPDGLAGESIPLSARIMAICDVYDALRSVRPYKSPLSHEDAIEVITKGNGRTSPEHFDPAMLAAFSASTERFQEIFEEYRDEEAPINRHLGKARDM